MERVDLNDTEADFVEFEFPDEATAERADGIWMFAAHTGATTRQMRVSPGQVEAARERLEAAGITWTEAESSITEDDMWPAEPGDFPDDEDDNEDDEDAEPSPGGP